MSSRAPAFDPESLLDRLLAYPHSGRFVVAFSGGADSTALLLALHQIRGRLPADIQALHVNHRVHAQADAWTGHCADFCSQRDIALHTVRADGELDGASGPEAALRQVRYQAFSDLLEPGDLLLQAHHRDDQAETVLLHLLRGSGVDGLAAIPEQRPLGRGWLVRPLLDTPRAALEAYLERHGVAWLRDPSNQDPSLDRNYIRHHVLPVLQERWPAAAQSLARSAAHCREAAEALAEAGLADLIERTPAPGILRLDQSLRTDAATLKRLLRSWLRENASEPVPRARLEEFVRQLAEGGPEAAPRLCWADWQLGEHNDLLWLQQPAELPACPTLDWDGRGALDLGRGLGSLRLVGDRRPDFPGRLTVSAREGGERMKPAGDSHHRPLKEQLRCAGLPPWLRACVPVTRLGDEILAVGDWQHSDTLSRWLTPCNARLEWAPRDPGLAWARARCHAAAVESGGALG